LVVRVDQAELVESVDRAALAGLAASAARADLAAQEALAAQAGQAEAGKRPIVQPRVRRAALAAALVRPLGPREDRT
jgi:hypothetical protein